MVGGTGLVGGIIVRGLLTDGSTVVVPSRSPDKLARLAEHDRTGRLLGVLVANDATPSRRADLIRRSGAAPRAVVAALGGWRTGPDLLDLGEDEWRQALADHLTAHLTCMQAYAPLIAERPDPVYLTLNGAAAVQPFPAAGPICVTGAAQRMLLDVMRVGRLGRRVRFHELSLMAAVAGDDRNLEPSTEIDDAQIIGAVRSILTDPAAPAHLEVHGRGPTVTGFAEQPWPPPG